MSEPRVLVLLAAYNGATWLRDQVTSIFFQKGVYPQLLVFDDRSTDTTRALLQELAGNGRLQFSENSKSTGSAAQNFFHAIRSSSATNYDYVAFSDQDDIWEDLKLLRATEALSTLQKPAVYSSSTLAFWPDGTQKVLSQNSTTTDGDFLFEGAGQGCTFVLTRTFYERVRAFLIMNPSLTDGVHYHDWTVYALCRCWQQIWIYDPVPLLRYRQHADNDTGARSSSAGISKRIALIRSGWYATQLKRMAALLMAANSDLSAVAHWNALLNSPPNLRRRLRIILFCVSKGRRRPLDRLVLLGSAALGWI